MLRAYYSSTEYTPVIEYFLLRNLRDYQERPRSSLSQPPVRVLCRREQASHERPEHLELHHQAQRPRQAQQA